jgi:hypothetical protein
MKKANNKMSDLSDLNQKISKWSLEVPLICRPDDERYNEHLEELNRTGISPDETWNLDVTFAQFVLPRLKKFKEVTDSYPNELNELYNGDEDEAVKAWNDILDDIIYSFERLAKRFEDDFGEGKDYWTEEDLLQIDDGLEKFASWYHHLWW